MIMHNWVDSINNIMDYVGVYCGSIYVSNVK